MYKGFLEFVRTEHPDPDSLLGDDFVFNELVKLADNYCEKQLLIQRVSQQSKLCCPNPDCKSTNIKHKETYDYCGDCRRMFNGQYSG